MSTREAELVAQLANLVVDLRASETVANYKAAVELLFSRGAADQTHFMIAPRLQAHLAGLTEVYALYAAGANHRRA